MFTLRRDITFQVKKASGSDLEQCSPSLLKELHLVITPLSTAIPIGPHVSAMTGNMPLLPLSIKSAQKANLAYQTNHL
jgi:hypothetical protein